MSEKTISIIRFIRGELLDSQKRLEQELKIGKLKGLSIDDKRPIINRIHRLKSVRATLLDLEFSHII